MIPDDFLAQVQLRSQALLGRTVRLGPATLDPILRRHAYPKPVALLLGEALLLAALVASLLKSHQRLSIQAQGEGPVPLLVAEHRAGGLLRGYARLRDGEAERLAFAHALAPAELVGEGALAITVDQGPDMDQVQGVVPLEGATLAACAEHYFAASEQTPTEVRLAVGESITGAGGLWRGGGLLIQRLAGDAARGDTEEDWRRACYLFATVTPAELLAPELGADRLLYRLFHEEGVRMGPPQPLRDDCPCEAARLVAVLSRFSPEELAEFLEPDGLVHARCQFCAREYRLAPEEIRAG